MLMVLFGQKKALHGGQGRRPVLGCVEWAIWIGSNAAVVNTLAEQLEGHRALQLPWPMRRPDPARAAGLGDFVASISVQSKAEEVSGIAAIGTCHDIAAVPAEPPPRGLPWAQGATVGQPCADCRGSY